jgi:pimeloyl-ACP methyl ester carboxylesterase
MQFYGKLFTYHEELRLTAFESGALDSNKTVVFLEGLGDGYNGVPYLTKLNDTVTKHGYSLIQMQTTSSYNGYGLSSVSNDAKELDYLVDYLRQRGKARIVVMGHSTGCQDCYWHNKYGERQVDGYILQAPVSDRQYYTDQCEEHNTHVGLAETMRDRGRGSNWMPQSISDVPITADRFYSLYSVL